MSRLIWINAVCNSLLLSPLAVKELIDPMKTVGGCIRKGSAEGRCVADFDLSIISAAAHLGLSIYISHLLNKNK